MGEGFSVAVTAEQRQRDVMDRARRAGLREKSVPGRETIKCKGWRRE